ncbi:MAG: type I glyceraldehyde-3-phosphate dehydrogenase [Anaerolineae bacterium]|nr:MAG: type I glyceraldehyde-3-phosphate dehydrogenase [Anaerolineae bacterium]MCL4877364.1 type I glyceraldehyde-3-phosphate dehydrogenase [Anaerolineae bacterium]
MAIRIGINGFGRIGRQVVKALQQYHRDKVDIVAFNDLGDLNMMAYLFRFDSNYGPFEGKVEVKEGALVIDGDEIKALTERDPAKIPWGDLGVDIVIESTGIFRSREKAGLHLQGGAQRVIISAPAKGEVDGTFVMGVNDHTYDPKKHFVVSNASCTTNCLAPAAKVLHDKFGIVSGLMTTIHSYTQDQRLLDAPHDDYRRARNAATNIVPTTTGAAKAVALVIPELKGKFDGISVRVPTPVGSLTDFVGILEREVTTEEVHAAFEEAAKGSLKGILQFSRDALVSSDIVGNPHSSIVDAEYTTAKKNMVKLLTWYDNEWGYSCRTADLAVKMCS